MYSALIALAFTSALTLASAGPIKVARDTSTYGGLPTNVLFMYTDKDCAQLQQQSLPLSGGVRTSDLFYYQNGQQISVSQEIDNWAGVDHAYVDMTRAENQDINIRHFESLKVKTIVWTIDEPKYNFQAERTDGGQQGISIGDTIWLVDVLAHFGAGWDSISVTSDGQERRFACKNIEQNWWLSSFKLTTR